MRRNQQMLIVLLALFALLGLGVSGCSTVEGFGKDIQKGGEAVERAADRNKPE